MNKKHIVALVVCCTLAIRLLAQPHFHFTYAYNSDKKELIRQLNVAKDDASRLNTLNNLIFYFPLVEGMADLDTLYLNQLITLNQTAKLIDVKPYLTLRAALRIDIKNNPHGVLLLLEKAVEEFDEQNTEVPALLTEMRFFFNLNNDQKGKYQYYSNKLSYYQQNQTNNNAAACYHCLSGYYIFENDLNQAINNYLKASELFKSYSNLWYAHDLGVAGNTYTAWGNKTKALFYLQKALKLETGFKITGDIDNLILDLAEVQYQQKNYQASLDYLDKVNDLVNKSKSPSRIINFKRMTIATARTLSLVGLNKLDEAKNQLQILNSLPPVQQIDRVFSTNQYSLPEYAFYKYSLAVSDLPKAEMYLLSAYHQASIYGEVQEKIPFLKELQQFYGQHNNAIKAWKYTRLYNNLQDSLQNRIGGINVASFENEQKENAQNKRLNQLQQQHAVQEATIRQRNVIIWISLAGIFLIAISLGFIYRQLNVNKRTLKHLKATQTQLIQSEKMASLGELTAGIAHEIQNPLNFVNNFSDVNREMLTELQEELDKGDITEAKAIAADIEQNEQKINHHGKRAEAIVKGMLEHSRSSTGQKELTDINQLADEYIRLSYHGLRAKDKSFNSELITNFDSSLPQINAIPQDIGRVLLNLFNNAFYAVNQKAKSAGDDYKPEVSVTTSTENEQVFIKVKDNGIGIPDAIKEKIMQPFFTTKPTGEGTGLGLSLTYDMVVKGHGGRMQVNSVEGEGSEFTISLPLS